MARMPHSFIPIVFFVPVCLLLIGYLVVREQTTERPGQLAITTAGMVEMCLNCHTREKLDGAHDNQVVGCSPCHLGDALAIDKDKAHRGMVLNPGDLRWVARTCGVEGCHPADIHKVKNSLMATNRGILATLLYYWGERDRQDAEITVEHLLMSGETSVALDYYRKLCATCHLWKQKGDLPGAPAFFNEKGGGCAACHYNLPPSIPRNTVTTELASTAQEAIEKRPHPQVVKQVPEENCIRCHNRSGRIGLSYTGIFEAEGYGTPYEKGHLSSQRLAGDRFYLKIAEDIHHTKGMVCIDCHIRDEIMGDGTSYAHYEDQVEITCQSCHDATPGTSRKGKPLTNVSGRPGQFILTGKIDGKEHPLRPPNQQACLAPGHQRLSCAACHSTWVPQCYGCHVKRDKRETHLDKLTLKETSGWWEEGRSYIRYEKPMLAVWGDKVVVVTPGCQDLVTLIDEKGASEGGFNRFTMAAINPHTIQAKGRTCKDCHAEPKTIGLGEGTVTLRQGLWQFHPVDRGLQSEQGRTPGLDTFVTIDGTPLQHGSRSNLRPFNGEELRRILRVGLCLDCHSKADDQLWRSYDRQRSCPVFKEL
ncbi:MAG: amino acid ABC transporter substrate-binding protein [Proteobacteria bacterium]|nr:amino acid ABC transporter substrate-binding protein [Pseudomonadota bacterium]